MCGHAHKPRFTYGPDPPPDGPAVAYRVGMSDDQGPRSEDGRTGPSLTRRGDVLVLHLGGDENRWTPAWVTTLLDRLDQVAAAAEPRALVTTADGRFWSTGLDLAWLQAHEDDPGELSTLFFQALARMLTLPTLTVAAVQGHAFGAGAMLAIAHDHRVMRPGHGFWCTPEVDLGMAFTDGVAALLQAKLTPGAARTAMLTGHRFAADEAVRTGVADVAADDVLQEAIAIAEASSARRGAVVGEIKARMYRSAHEALLADVERHR